MPPNSSYKQKLRDVWLKRPDFQPWIRKDSSDETRAYCSYCKCSIMAKLYDVQAHVATKKHQSNSSCFSQKSKLPFGQINTKTEEQEAVLSLFVAEHTAIGTVDHLAKLCIGHFCNTSSSGQIKIQRTKCTNIIKNVLAPHFYEDLRSDIGDSHFSLLLDESTDISITKLLGK